MAKFTYTWRTALVAIALSSALLIAFYWSTAVAMVQQWLTGTYSHGFLVLPASLYLAWTRRRDLATLCPQPSLWVLFLVGLCALGWLLGHLTATDVVQQLSLVTALILLIWGIVGTDIARRLVFPLSFLFFAVPIGEGLIPVLQDFSAWFAVSLLDLSAVPVLLEGRFISVPYGKWEVAEVCSGIRALIACVAMGYLYAGLMYQHWSRRIGFLVAAAVVPVVANGIRIYGIVLLGYWTGNAAAVAADHLLAGWVFTTIVMILLLAAGQLMRERVPPLAMAPSVARETPFVTGNSVVRVGVFVSFAIGILALAPTSADGLWRRLEGAGAIVVASPHIDAPWYEIAHQDGGWEPQFGKPNAVQRRTYAAGNKSVWFYAAYFNPAERTEKLVSTAHALYDRNRWRRVAEREVAIAVEGETFQARETIVGSVDSALTIWSWYLVDGRFTGNSYLAKLLLARARLKGNRLPSIAFAVATHGRMGDEVPAQVLHDFIARIALRRPLLLAAVAAEPIQTSLVIAGNASCRDLLQHGARFGHAAKCLAQSECCL